MGRINDGGPAFPRALGGFAYRDGSHEIGSEQDGMTLRDYFAAQALQGIAYRYGGTRAGAAAKKAYEIADLMLVQRRNQEGGGRD